LDECQAHSKTHQALALTQSCSSPCKKMQHQTLILNHANFAEEHNPHLFS